LNADRAPQLKAGVSDQIEEGLRSLDGGSKWFEEEEQFTGESEHQ
jgi:hypothetical protein